jgi:hypothetical protein
MSTLSDKLAQALNALRFVQAVEHEQNGTAIQVLCRLKPHFGVQWSALAEAILRAAIRRVNTNEYWHTHIARVYMIRNEALVYGWTFMIAAVDPEKAVNTVCGIITKFTSAGNQPTPQPTAQPQQQTQAPPDPPSNYDDDDDPDAIREDDDYTDPEGPLPKGAVPEADEQGNPIVPRAHRVKRVQMAGLPKDFDRNVPDPEKRKGAWSIETRKGKPFRPPVRS